MITNDYIDMINNESPIKKKGLWNRIKFGIFSVLYVSIGLGSYITYDKTDYVNKANSMREAYLKENYVLAENLCMEQSKNNILFGVIPESDSPELLKTVTQKIKELQTKNLSDKYQRKIKKDIELLLFKESNESILRLSKYVGSYSSAIDSLSQTKTANNVLSKIFLADYDNEMYLNTEDISFLVKIILENQNDIKNNNNNNTINSIKTVDSNNYDYITYYEKKAEKTLYQSISDTTDMSMLVQNLYLEAINAATDNIMISKENDLNEKYMKVKIQELTTRLNLIEEYIQVLKYVEYR